MELRDLVELQKRFDARFFPELFSDPDERKRLLFFATTLAGEVGEFCNVVKNYALMEYGIKHTNLPTKEELESKLREELVDVFICVLILSYILGMDLEKEYKEKLKKVAARFGEEIEI